jgi:hypothetical protein
MVMKIDGSLGVTYPDGSVQNSQPSGRNRIVNGGMRIDQRRGGASATINTALPKYVVDHWATRSASGSFTAQRTGTPGNYALTLTATTSTDDVTLVQYVESEFIADLATKQVTLSFTASSSSVTTLPWAIFSANSVNDFTNRTLIANGNLTISSTPTRYQVTFTLSAAAANGISVYVSNGIVLSAGNTFVVTNVQLEEGTFATAFERELISSEIDKCQRYYETGTYKQFQSGGASCTGAVNFRTLKRIAPNVSPASLTYAAAPNGNYPPTSTEWVTNSSFGVNRSTDGQLAFTWYASAQLTAEV